MFTKKIILRASWDIKKEDIDAADIFIAESPALLEKLQTMTDKKVYHIIPGLDLTRWRYIQQPHKFTVGFCGDVSTPHRYVIAGYDILLSAIKSLSVPLVCAVYNNGNYSIEHSKMYDEFYSKISVLVHLTTSNDFSFSVMEALACGVPVLMYQTSSFHSVMLRNWEDVIFCKRDKDDVRTKIQLLKNEDMLYEKIRYNGRCFAERYHNINTTIQMYQKLLDEVE